VTFTRARARLRCGRFRPTPLHKATVGISRL
jgi:hypothetical protein